MSIDPDATVETSQNSIVYMVANCIALATPPLLGGQWRVPQWARVLAVAVYHGTRLCQDYGLEPGINRARAYYQWFAAPEQRTLRCEAMMLWALSDEDGITRGKAIAAYLDLESRAAALSGAQCDAHDNT